MRHRLAHILGIERQTPMGQPFSDLLDWCVFAFVLLFGGLFAYYIYAVGLSLVLVDQFSHLSMARQITDSLTPGMSQVGFWPPLLHILLAPFTAFDALYFSGYASALLMVPLLGLSVVLLARLLYLLTQERLLSYLFALTLLCNPYVLYFSVTPMMEMLFLATLIGATYFFARWWLTLDLSALILTGAFVSLGTLARFEGFILLPLIGMLMLVRLVAGRVKRTEIEALAFIFAFIAMTGVVFTLVYGFIYNDNPLAFMSNNWGAYAQQRDLTLPGEGNIIEAARYMSAAAKEMIGLAPLLGMVSTFVFLLVTLVEQRRLVFAVIAVLVSPFFFDVLATFQGSAVIYVPDLPPYPNSYFNVRYGLFLAAAAVVIPAIAATLIARTFYTPRRALAAYLVPSAYVLVLVAFSGGSLFVAANCPDCFPVVQRSQQVSPNDHTEVAMTLREHYDGGFVLMTRALHNEVAVRSGIPLKNFILEANEHYYARAVEAPWRYARFVVMFNPSEDIHQDWQRQNEVISRTWAQNPEFEHFYEQIYISDAESVYRLRESVLREHIVAHGIPEDLVPALSTSTERWDVQQTHNEIERALVTSEVRQAVMGDTLPRRAPSSI